MKCFKYFLNSLNHCIQNEHRCSLVTKVRCFALSKKHLTLTRTNSVQFEFWYTTDEEVCIQEPSCAENVFSIQANPIETLRLANIYYITGGTVNSLVEVM